MSSPARPLLVLSAALSLLTPPLRAEHASIDLTLSGGGQQVEAFTDQEPPPGGVQKRPVLTVKAGEPLVFQFFLTNVYPHGLISNVTVRYSVRAAAGGSPEGAAGKEAQEGKQEGRAEPKGPPDAAGVSVTEGSMTLNFKPRCRVGSRVCFKAPPPGRYLVRVDTEGTKSDHEHFSAVDLVVVADDGRPR